MEQLSRSAVILWVAGLVMNSALLTVLVLKRRVVELPAFTAWITWAVISTIGMFFGRAHGSRQLYATLYWTAAFVDLLLQLAVVFELAAVVFRRSGTWIANSRTKLGSRAGASALIAIVLALGITPAASSARDALYSRISLFETILFTGLFLALMTVSQELGVSWRDLVVREGAGFLLMNLSSFLTDTLHAYWRTADIFGDLEHVRMAVYLAVLAYWIVVFWQPERNPVPLGATERGKLAAFQAQRREKN